MSIRLRVKGPKGNSKTINSNNNETLTSFLVRMADLFECSSVPLSLLSGYPPQQCSAVGSELISSFLKSGDSVSLREEVVSSSSPIVSKMMSTVPTTIADISTGHTVYYTQASGVSDMVEVIGTHPGPPAVPESYTAVVRDSIDSERIGRELNILYKSPKLSLHPITSSATTHYSSSGPTVNPSSLNTPPPAPTTWACSACTYQNVDNQSACAICETPRQRGASNSTASTQGVTSTASRHRIPDDNSCLFHATIFLLNRTDSTSNLRNMIATTVRNDPVQWNDAMLGKPRDEYIRFITDPTKWGGQVELNILCTITGVEIAAVDIQTGRMDVYGSGCGYTQRVYMLFSGIHFDAITFGCGNSAIKQVSADDVVAERSAADLAASLRSSGAYTDQQTMQLVCQSCGWEMSGDYEARLHAGSSGHTDFKMKKAH